MMRIATLASGSSGNCVLVSDGQTHILIDAGISARRITVGLRKLGVEPTELSAVLITHEHTDHIAGLNVLKKQLDCEICATGPVAQLLCRDMDGLEERLRTFDPGDGFSVGSLYIESFPTVHDSVCSVGYAVSGADGEKMALATDLGTITGAVERGIAGARLVIVESNYDADRLRNGYYPPFLKKRIMSDCGHLSNEMGSMLALRAVARGARTIVLAHLSMQNNDPYTAYRQAEQVFTKNGFLVGWDVALYVAPRHESSGWLTV